MACSRAKSLQVRKHMSDAGRAVSFVSAGRRQATDLMKAQCFCCLRACMRNDLLACWLVGWLTRWLAGSLACYLVCHCPAVSALCHVMQLPDTMPYGMLTCVCADLCQSMISLALSLSLSLYMYTDYRFWTLLITAYSSFMCVLIYSSFDMSRYLCLCVSCNTFM